MNIPYELELTETLENKFKKLQKKDRVHLRVYNITLPALLPVSFA